MPRTLETARLLLRVPVIEDAEDIFKKYAQDIEVTKYLTWKPHQNIEFTRKIVSSFIDSWETQSDFPWVILKKEDNNLMGMINLHKNHGITFGYVLAKQYWGNGYMTEALRTVVDWSLKQPDIHRVWAVHDIDNSASGRVMEKAGLQFEGILKKYSVHPNVSEVPRDCKCYSIVK